MRCYAIQCSCVQRRCDRTFKALVLGSSPSPLTTKHPNEIQSANGATYIPDRGNALGLYGRFLYSFAMSLPTIFVVEKPSTVGTISTRPPAAITTSCPTTVSIE